MKKKEVTIENIRSLVSSITGIDVLCKSLKSHGGYCHSDGLLTSFWCKSYTYKTARHHIQEEGNFDIFPLANPKICRKF